MVDGMSTSDLHAQAVLTIYEIVDLRRWGQRAKVFGHVARRQLIDGGAVPIAVRTIADAIGGDQRYVFSLVKRLVDDDRALEVVEPGRGRRPATYRVNPDIDRWRNVTFTVPMEVAMWRLDALGFGRAKYLSRLAGPDRASLGGQRATVSPAALQSAALQDFSAAILRAAQPPSASSEIREVLDAVRELTAALIGRDRDSTTGEVPRPWTLDQDQGDGAAARRSPEIASLSLVEPQRDIDAAQRGALLTAITTATSGGTLWGAGAHRAGELLRGVPLEQLLAWCDEEAARRRDRPLAALALLSILEARSAGASEAHVRAVPQELVANLRRLVLTMLEVEDLELAAQRLAELRTVDEGAAAELVAQHPALEALVAT